MGQSRVQTLPEKALEDGNRGCIFTTRTQICAYIREVVQLRGREAKTPKALLAPSMGGIALIHYSCSSLEYPRDVLKYFFISAKLLMCTMASLVPPAPCLPLVLCWKGQCPWNYLKVNVVFLEAEPCTPHLFSLFLIQKHHRNSLLPPQEIICK